MRKNTVVIFLLSLLTSSLSNAQPTTVKNAAKGVFSLQTFRDDGSLLATSHGVFISENGEAVSELKPFLGAKRAVIIDHRGAKAEVKRMIGVDPIYDVARFSVDTKSTAIQIAKTKAQVGSKAWLVGYALKNPEIKETTIKSVEPFGNQFSYYIFGMNAPDNAVACPMVNADGDLIGLLQVSTTSFDTHATDAAYIKTLSVNGLSYNDPTLSQIAIPLALPQNEQQAQLALMMATQSGYSLKYAAAAEDFIAAYPTMRDGYEALARLQMSYFHFNEANQTMERALKNVANKDESHYDFARIILDKELNMPQANYEQWNLDKAMSEASAAYDLNPVPIYKHLQARILYAQGDFQQACSTFKALSLDKSFATPELLYQQAQCKLMTDADKREAIALLDSAINATDTLRIVEAAPYFYTRAQAYEATDSFRQAVFDYTRYEILCNGRVSADFYFIREQAEVKGRLYKQALSDIARAIILAPQEPTYYAEMAQLQLRFNQIEEAVQTAKRCTEINPNYPEGWLVYGLALAKNGDKATGLESMRKAKELGNSQAEELIKKYE